MEITHKNMNKFKTLKLFFLMLFVSVNLSARHYTVVISLDGFRWDYTNWYDFLISCQRQEFRLV